jgi:hypothetical protein
MKQAFLSLIIGSTGLLAGCQTSRNSAPIVEHAVSARAVTTVAYDDRLIASIKRGETTEPKLLEWFGAPESRDLRPDGRSHLTWSFRAAPENNEGVSGALQVSLNPDGKVEAYSASRRSTPHNQGALAPVGYADQSIARIKRGVTTEAQLLEWFGPPEKRNAAPDGRRDLSWSFAPTFNSASGQAAALHVSLAANGSVDAYSAHDVPR